MNIQKTRFCFYAILLIVLSLLASCIDDNEPALVHPEQQHRRGSARRVQRPNQPYGGLSQRDYPRRPEQGL